MKVYNIYVQSDGMYKKNVDNKQMYDHVKKLLEKNSKRNIVVYNNKNKILFLSSSVPKQERFSKLEEYYQQH